MKIRSFQYKLYSTGENNFLAKTFVRNNVIDYDRNLDLYIMRKTLLVF